MARARGDELLFAVALFDKKLSPKMSEIESRSETGNSPSKEWQGQ